MTGPGQPAAQAAVRTGAQAAPTSAPAAPAASPAPASAPAPTPAPARTPSRRSTPSLLRWARGVAAGAALLTGIAATGTFDTDGVNSTPNVVVQEWAAAERAGTEIALAELGSTRLVAEEAAGLTEDQRGVTDAAVREALTGAAVQQARSGTGTTNAEAAGRLVDVGFLTQDAARLAATDPAAAAERQAEAVAQARAASAITDDVALDRADALQTRSRSAFTAAVGGASTLVLLGILIWLALRTRRIVNVPLLVATAITAGLTYASLNPTALPLNYDQRVQGGVVAAQALQQVRETRAEQYLVVLGSPTSSEAFDTAAGAAEENLAQLDLPAARDDWATVVGSHADVTAADGTAARLEAVAATEAEFDDVETTLQQLVDDALATAQGQVGTPAAITSGAALLLGLLAAAMAWSGIGQRLKDYR
ncbi:hypothetical protein [Ornithinimicrobium sp. LYQ103]|uniref:hypothetical protein n=1 Tax=Ornithinimicrobium sp. LYQ103 TaxID=3378796 RepID=UPI0038538432